MSVVDTIYNEFQDAVRILRDAQEISLQIMLESNLRKTLLLGAASYFEVVLTREVQRFTSEITSGNELVNTLVYQKAITRQYHSWFEWTSPNANKFFSMFGPSFKEHMTTKINRDDVYKNSVKSFLTIGNERNLLVHSDYGSMYIDRTPAEIYALYQSANLFVESVSAELRLCSHDIAAAAAAREAAAAAATAARAAAAIEEAEAGAENADHPGAEAGAENADHPAAEAGPENADHPGAEAATRIDEQD